MVGELRLVQPAPKTCTKCGGSGPFGKKKTSPDGLESRCKVCRSADRKARQAKHNEYLRQWTKDHARDHRNSQIRYRHKIEWEAAWMAQRGLCAMCGELMLPLGNAAGSAIVDHDHSCCPGTTSCGKCFRGLIHGNCNQVLGRAKDNIAILEAAIAYLKKHKKGE